MEEYAIRVGQRLHERLIAMGWTPPLDEEYWEVSQDSLINHLCLCLEEELNPVVAPQHLPNKYAPQTLEIHLTNYFDERSKAYLHEQFNLLDDAQIWDFCSRLNQYKDFGREVRAAFMLAYNGHPITIGRDFRFAFLQNDGVYMSHVYPTDDLSFSFETEVNGVKHRGHGFADHQSALRASKNTIRNI